MKVEKVSPVYKSTFNSKPNPDNKNNQKNKQSKPKENPSVILEISKAGRKKLEDDFER